MITKLDVETAFKAYIKERDNLVKAVNTRDWSLCQELSPTVDALLATYQQLENEYNNQTPPLPQLFFDVFVLLIYNRDHSFIETVLIEDLSDDVGIYFEGLSFDPMPLKKLCKAIRQTDDFLCVVIRNSIDLEDCEGRVLDFY